MQCYSIPIQTKLESTMIYSKIAIPAILLMSSLTAVSHAQYPASRTFKTTYHIQLEIEWTRTITNNIRTTVYSTSDPRDAESMYDFYVSIWQTGMLEDILGYDDFFVIRDIRVRTTYEYVQPKSSYRSTNIQNLRRY